MPGTASGCSMTIARGVSRGLAARWGLPSSSPFPVEFPTCRFPVMRGISRSREKGSRRLSCSFALLMTSTSRSWRSGRSSGGERCSLSDAKYYCRTRCWSSDGSGTTLAWASCRQIFSATSTKCMVRRLRSASSVVRIPDPTHSCLIWFSVNLHGSLGFGWLTAARSTHPTAAIPNQYFAFPLSITDKCNFLNQPQGDQNANAPVNIMSPLLWPRAG